MNHYRLQVKALINIFILGLCLSYGSLKLKAQVRHMDYLGAGHINNVRVTASDSNDKSQETIDGFDIQNEDQIADASRFLAQSTLGTDWHTIQTAAAMGYEAWLEEQFALPEISYHEEEMAQTRAGYGFGYRLFGSTWMTNTLTTPDILRQRMNFVLSQIMVLSGNTMMVFQRTDAHPLSAYYDILQKNSFGNYRDLLYDISVSPQMGHFLSHYNNPKADTINRINPDENFAREIMQLFSIGLWELNRDGSLKLDSDNQPIATYNNADIKEFAQVFTGFGTNRNAAFGSLFGGDWTKPMQMFDDFHDTSSKVLLNGYVIPANNSGLDDVSLTIDHLSSHENTAPFICKALIQHFTSSNPSPEYINDVVDAFNAFEENNFQELIKAILLHPEARTCKEDIDPFFGKLKEPTVRLCNFLKAFPISANINGDYWNFLRCPIFRTGQAPLQAPSVFNFFSREYKPKGSIGDNDLYGPEFQILSAPNTIGIINDVNTRVVDGIYMEDGCGIFGMFEPTFYQEDISLYEMDFSELETIDQDPARLIRRLNLHLANGALDSHLENIISEAISQLNDTEERIKLAIYAILISPDYAILK